MKSLILCNIKDPSKNSLRFQHEISHQKCFKRSSISYAAIAFLAILENFADIALKMLKKHSMLALERDENNDTGLHVLARQPGVFTGRSQWWLPNQILDYSKFLQSLLILGKLGNRVHVLLILLFMHSSHFYQSTNISVCVNIYLYIIKIHNK